MGLALVATALVSLWGFFTILQELGMQAALLVLGLTAVISIIIFRTSVSTTHKPTS